MKRFKPDLTDLPRFTADERAAFAAMTAEEIERNAESDPDNPPSTEDELQRLRVARRASQKEAHRG